jgi:hypothetical protein
LEPLTGFTAAPGASLATEPLADLSAMQCDCTTTDQKQRKKKRKPRNICYRGVYEDRRNGLVKLKRERITCR